MTEARHPSEYTLLFIGDEDATCSGCAGEWWGDYPTLALLGRGPLCGDCVDRQPKWIQHLAAALREAHSAAVSCPDQYLGWLRRSLAKNPGLMVLGETRLRAARAAEDAAEDGPES